MLELRNYNRQELIDIYKTDRLDAIKNKIKRAGYSFNNCGKGKDYVMQITSLPDADKQLEEYCIKELGFPAQTDFAKLKAFLYNFLINDEFMTKQINEMQEILELQGVSIWPQTISKYCDKLKELGWQSTDVFNYVYSVYDYTIKHNRYITKDEYCLMYKHYWQTVEKYNYSSEGFSLAEIEIRKKYGSKPKKRMLQVKNGIFNQQYDTVMSLLNKKE